MGLVCLVRLVCDSSILSIFHLHFTIGDSSNALSRFRIGRLMTHPYVPQKGSRITDNGSCRPPAQCWQFIGTSVKFAGAKINV